MTPNTSNQYLHVYKIAYCRKQCIIKQFCCLFFFLFFDEKQFISSILLKKKKHYLFYFVSVGTECLVLSFFSFNNEIGLGLSWLGLASHLNFWEFPKFNIFMNEKIDKIQRIWTKKMKPHFGLKIEKNKTPLFHAFYQYPSYWCGLSID